MDHRTQKVAPRPEVSSALAVSPSRSPYWPDGRIGPAVDPDADRRWAIATLAMLGVVVVTLGSLIIG